MLAVVQSAVVQGVDGHSVSVEVHVSGGLPGYNLVGLPDVSCRESRDRVRAAILSSGLVWPARRITVNLAPSSIPKQGAALDLPIALGLLVASGQLPESCMQQIGAVGELGLDGSVRPVSALVSLADAVASPEILVPASGAEQAAIVRPGAVRPAITLAALVSSLRQEQLMPALIESSLPLEKTETLGEDLKDVRGQPLARWALEICATGGHHMLMIGPPGAGKTMLATRLARLLPRLDKSEALEATRVHSAAGLAIPPSGLIRRPPLRAPHHGASLVAMTGGGTSAMRPGEISCAHGGVLFLDELGEFPPPVLDSLRQPLEEGKIRVSRAVRSVSLPARFLLIAAMNPCPCGEGGVSGQCRCSESARARYSKRLSGPLLDRFDLRVEVAPPAADVLLGDGEAEDSDSVSLRIDQARRRATERGLKFNSLIPPDRVDEIAPLSKKAKELLRKELLAGRLTGRGLFRVRTVARTISDLQEGPHLIDEDLAHAALSLRVIPRSVFGVAS